MKRVRPGEYLDLLEERWAGRLRGVSLVAEVEIRQKQGEQAAKALGILYRRRMEAGRKPELVFDNWPACTELGDHTRPRPAAA